MFSQSNNLITGGTFSFTQLRNDEKGPYERLLEASSPSAFHDSGRRRNPPKCHPNTRATILGKIMDWVFSLDQETKNALIVWLYGAAGAGKSAIAQTIAERCSEEQILLASYFFSRFDPMRNHPRSLIASIAYQLSSRFPKAREVVLNAISMDPLIFARTLRAQAIALIVDPLRDIAASGFFVDPKSRRVVIIDGLDECEDREGQVDILHTIADLLQYHHLPLLFIIASRPELDIAHTFDSDYLCEASFRLHLNDRWAAQADIDLYLCDKFSEIRKTHPLRAQIPETWPARQVLRALLEKSSGQFIYASMVVKFVGSTRHCPTDRLDIVVGLRPAMSSRDLPFAELDALYRHVFSTIENLEAVLLVLAFYVLSEPYVFELSIMEDVLTLRRGEIRLLLSDMSSLINVIIESGPTGSSEFISFHHASLQDFLLDRSRSRHFHISKHIWYKYFAVMVLRFIKTALAVLGPVKPLSENSFWYSSLFLHVQSAPPVAILRDEILGIDLSQFVQGPNFDLFTPDCFLRDMTAAIRKSQLPDAKELYYHVIHTFDEFAKSQLQLYYSDPGLTTLVVYMFTRLNGHVAPFWQDVSPYEYLLYMDDQQRLIDAQGLRLIDGLMRNGYAQFFVEFLEDIDRSGYYTMTSEKYATAAMYLLQRTCYHAPEWTKAFHGNSFSKSKPWRWSQRAKRMRNIYQRTRGRLQKELWYKSRIWTPYCNQATVPNFHETIPGQAFLVALYGLTIILDAASPSKELITLARRRTFGPMMQAFPEYTKLAKKAIRRYLKRVGHRE